MMEPVSYEPRCSESFQHLLDRLLSQHLLEVSEAAAQHTRSTERSSAAITNRGAPFKVAIGDIGYS